jgi:hypothetical protein
MTAFGRAICRQSVDKTFARSILVTGSSEGGAREYQYRENGRFGGGKAGPLSAKAAVQRMERGISRPVPLADM